MGRFEVSDDLPPLAGWYVEVDGARQGGRRSPDETMLLPPGAYDVFVEQPGILAPIPWLRGLVTDPRSRVLVPVTSAVEVQLAGSPPLAGAEPSWTLTRHGSTEEIAMAWTGVCVVPPGGYDLSWRPDLEHVPLLWSSSLRVAPNAITEIRIDSGLALRIGARLPAPGKYGWWGVARAGEAPEPPLNWSRGADAVALPAARYDVYWKQDGEHDPLLWSADVLVEPGRVAEVTVDSGLELRLGPGLPALDEYGWWGAARAGEAPEPRLHWSRGAGAVPLPPGRYDVYWKQDGEHDPLLWSVAVEVEPGRVAEVTVDSGVRLQPEPGLPALGEHGWWGMARAGEPPESRLHWSHGAGVLPLPAGRYDLYWAPELAVPFSVATDVEVRAGQVTRVPPRRRAAAID